MSVIDGLKSPSEIKNLSAKELNALSEELREMIISATGKNGGHLSANLGIVETIVALYNAFDFSSDKLIFDVGHQCYAHKILSGRKDSFSTIRSYGGLSGFPDVAESAFDTFTTGHAGASISSALGLCTARDKLGEDYTVVCVVGDGSLSNGLNLEAITASVNKPQNLIVILNDNGMSISKNRGGVYKLISKSTTRRGYLKSKRAFKTLFRNSFITRFFRRIRGLIKRVFNGVNYFEKFGFKYVGVCDGNDLKELVGILSSVKQACKEKAILLHVKTTKGKGHKAAEEHADLYHGVGKNFKQGEGAFSSALGEALVQRINNDGKIVAITAAMKDGTGLSLVEKAHPRNFYDVGIAEEYAVTFAAGLAKGGLKPIVCIYSTFLQRCYDQIMHDVCLQNLPVIFCVDRAGLVGEDGKTHQGVFDLSFLSHMPNLTLLAPASKADLESAIDYAIGLRTPVVIRYPKNGTEYFTENTLPYAEVLWTVEKEGEQGAILAVGPKMLDMALSSVGDKDYAVINARSVKPLDTALLGRFTGKRVITLEENSVIGGFGSMVNGYYVNFKEKTELINLGVKDSFIEHAPISKQLELNGLTKEKLIEIL